MKWHMTRTVICTLLLIVFALLSVGCNISNETISTGSSDSDEKNPSGTTSTEVSVGDSESEAPETTRPTFSDYSIECIDGQHYIIFDDASVYDISYDNMCVLGFANVEFSSIQEMKERVTEKKLEEGEKEIIVKNFNENEIGFRICDFNHLYIPDVPDEFDIPVVYWSGEFYTYRLGIGDNGWGHLTCYGTKDSYEQSYQYEFEDFYNYRKNTAIRITSKKELSDRNAVEIIYNGSNKDILYTLKSENKIYTVKEEYRDTSQTVPDMVTVFCTDGTLHYRLQIDELTEIPTKEWLLRFGMTEYVEESTEDTAQSE